MEKFSRNKLNVALWTVAGMLALGLAAYAALAAQFAVHTLQAAYDANLIKAGEIVTFDMAKIAELRRMRAR